MIHPALAANPLQTRDDMCRMLCDLLAPLAPWRSPEAARVRLSDEGASFDQTAAEVEGFARPLWGAVPAALGGADVLDWAMIRRGLAHGTDPGHPEFWHLPRNLDQRLVEMAAIGFALLAVPERVWHPLPARDKANLAAYLRHATTCRFSPNNWMFFRLLIDAGLRRVGQDVPDSAGDAERAALEALYLGDGWYRDGPGRRVDHYVGFAFHTYGLLLHRFAPQTDAGQHLARARLFAPQFAAWFDEAGRGLPFGRSMTYRFAMVAFFGAYALAETDPVLPWGVLKGIVLRHLRWWAGQPMADRDGVLPIGFAYPNPHMAEDYNSPQSPYWALKAFLPLALAEDHPFWQAEELPLPAALPRVQVQPGMILQALPGQVVALTAGQESRNFRHGAEKYAKFAYSTRFPFSVEMRDSTLSAAALDGMLGLQAEGRPWVQCCGVTDAMISDAGLLAIWQPYPDVRVETWLQPHGPGHLRLHRITSGVALETVEGGFALRRREGNADRQQTGPAFARVEGEGHSLIRGLPGDRRAGRVHGPAANTNLQHPRSWVPQLTGRIAPGVTLLACHVQAGDAADLPELPEPDLRVFSHTGFRPGTLTGQPNI